MNRVYLIFKTDEDQKKNGAYVEYMCVCFFFFFSYLFASLLLFSIFILFSKCQFFPPRFSMVSFRLLLFLFLLHLFTFRSYYLHLYPFKCNRALCVCNYMTNTKNKCSQLIHCRGVKMTTIETKARASVRDISSQTRKHIKYVTNVRPYHVKSNEKSSIFHI